MTDSTFNIRHGALEDVIGSPQSQDGILFVPARVTLNGAWFESTLQLMDCIGDLSPAITAIVRPGEDAPWVLGRLIRLFNTDLVPEEDRLEKTCFYAAFIAVLPDDNRTAIPFECQDYYGKSALTFSTDDPPSEEIQQTIGIAFWNLLLASPKEISDYEDKMFHSGAGFWIRYGVLDGEPFMNEELDME